MIIKTAEVPEGGSETTTVLTNLHEKPGWPQFNSGLQCRCTFDRDGGRIIAWIEFSGNTKLECARCLNQFDCLITGNTAVVLEHASATQKGDEAGDSGVDFVFDDSNPDIDISQPIYEELLLSFPLKPLCAKNCAGVSWNGGEAEAVIDPRWDALRRLQQTGCAAGSTDTQHKQH